MAKVKPTIGITMGDPAGIGPEIAIKAASSPEIQRIANPVIIGDARVIQKSLKSARARKKLRVIPIKSIKEALFSYNNINVLTLHNVNLKTLKVGTLSAESGKASIEYVEKAIELALQKEIAAISTGPINKEAIHTAGYKFAGHTEFLAKKTKASNYGMLFVSSPLWLMLVTTHLPIKRVAQSISKEKVFEKIKLAYETLKLLKRKNPKIGVAGLNPHAGEGGIFGNEEIKAIIPAIKKAKASGMDVKGPISPDAIFNLAKAQVFDIIIAMYHDQGLIPLKLLAFNKSVNVTVGLPIIRTSVDHGTGYDIAGKGFANPGSLKEAIKVAVSFSNVSRDA